jgi:Toprim domain
MTALDLAIIGQIAHGRFGKFEAACPQCGPERRRLINQRKPVLCIWRLDEHFATYGCARCGMKGHARDGSIAHIDPAAIARAKAEAAERARATRTERLSKAHWLWRQSRPLVGTIGERYLREARGYGGPLPATLRFLPPSGDYPPAMLAAFGIMPEPEPGRLDIDRNAVSAVHITRLARDGSGKAGTERDKIMVGLSAGSPIVLAPPNDGLGLAITEGIEDALSAHVATGLGAWAAGAASFLPALATGIIPPYVECITILADSDPDGERHAAELARRLKQQSRAVRLVRLVPCVPAPSWSAAA